MLFRRFLPKEIRKAYSYDSVAAILAGIHLGLIVPFLAIVDRRLGGHPYHIALITAAPFFGSLLTYFWALVCFISWVLSGCSFYLSPGS